MRSAIGFAWLSLFAGRVWAQGAPGTNLSVTARLTAITMRGDTTTISFVVTNSLASQEDLFTFTVEAPSPVVRINLPGPSAQWTTDSKVKGISVASWGMLGTHLARGSQTPELVFEAIGLPGVVTYWAQGWFPVPEYHPIVRPDSVLSPREALAANSILGKTVGVESFSNDRSPAILSLRLNDLNNQVCGSLGWVTDSGVCAALRANIDTLNQLIAQSANAGARARLAVFLSQVAGQHDPIADLPITDNAYWLLKVNAEYILGLLSSGSVTSDYLVGSGGTANPPTLSLSNTAPTGTTSKYKDSPAVTFTGGNPWAEVGTWTASPALSGGTLTALGDAHVWLGLKNSDDIGTNFDLRVEAYRNGSLIASGLTRCIQGVTRNASQAKEVAVPFTPASPAAFNGTTDVLAIKLLTRVGTTDTGALCGGHSNAVGLRLYFDATGRAAQLTTTF